MDQAFIQEARNLAHQAKAIIQAAEQALKLQHQTSDPTVASAGDTAVAAVGADANAIDAFSTGGYDGSIPAPSTPAISITACRKGAFAGVLDACRDNGQMARRS
jgi:hypothetical protein